MVDGARILNTDFVMGGTCLSGVGKVPHNNSHTTRRKLYDGLCGNCCVAVET